MKVAPVSADLLIKLALGVVAVAGVVYAARWVSSKVSSGIDAATDAALKAAQAAAESVNPLSDKNLAYRAASELSTVVAGRDETAGGLFRAISSDDDQRVADMLAGRKTNTVQGYSLDNLGAMP